MNNDLIAQMRTKKEIRKYAKGFARQTFYSHGDTPWEPFENHSKAWLDEQVQDLANDVAAAMYWAQGEDATYWAQGGFE